MTSHIFGTSCKDDDHQLLGLECINCDYSNVAPYINPRTPCACAFCWKMKKQWRAPEREPTIHLIEALADSANQMLVHNNIEGVKDRLNRILTVTREIIRECEREVPTCMYIPKGTRAKCGYPLVNGKCNIHGQRFEDITVFFSTKERRRGEDLSHLTLKERLNMANPHPPSYNDVDWLKGDIVK